MKELLEFKTRNLRSVAVYDTGTKILNETVYAINTVNSKHEILVRFGNKTQMLSMLIGYRHSVMPDSQGEDYERFMEENYYKG